MLLYAALHIMATQAVGKAVLSVDEWTGPGEYNSLVRTACWCM